MPSVPGNTVSILNPTIPIDQSIYEASSTQKAKLGTRLEIGDRTFRYAKLAASANEIGGTVVCAPLALSSFVSQVLTVSSAAAGATQVLVAPAAAVTAGFFNEGYFSVASTLPSGASGLCVRVKKQDSGTATVLLTLYDPIPSSIGAGPCNLVQNQYNSVKPDSDVLGYAVGVLPCNVTTGEYFWLQTYGPASPRHSSNLVANAALVLGTAGMVKGYITSSAILTGQRVIGVNSNLVSIATQCCPATLLMAP